MKLWPTGDPERDYIATNRTLQHASARRYSPDAWLILESEPGVFALISAIHREVVLITDDWNEVLEAYRARPAFVAPTPKPYVGKVNLASLEFKL